MPIKLGVIGVGHMTGAMVDGWCRGGKEATPSIALSPRNAAKAASLSEKYGLDVMAGNAEVVESSDVVVLGVRPWQVEEAFSGLPWREGQLAVSVIAGIKQQDLARLVTPAKVVRAMPVTACAFGESANALYPPDPQAEALLEPLGAVTLMTDEEAFDKLAVHGCTYGWLLSLMEEISQWSIEAGVPAEAAQRHVAQTFRAAGTTALLDGAPIKDLVDELASPGSYTGMGLEVLREKGAYAPWRSALDRIKSEYEG